jgi:1,4-dihydroxy-2-naphthoate octaprenyltransferase
MTLGAFYVQTQMLRLEPVIASIPVSLLILAVLYINEFPDYAADKAVGKRTLVVRMGRDKAVQGYAFIVFGAYVSVFLSVLFGITPVYTLLAVIPLPLAVASVRHALKFHSEPFKLVPSNAATIVLHLVTSLLLSLGYLLDRLALGSMEYFLVIIAVGMCTLFTVGFYLKVRKPEGK